MIYLTLFFLSIFALLLRFNFYRLPKKGISVLLYHRIDDSPTNSSLDKFSISPSIFEKQIKYLKKKGYTSILPSEIEQLKKNRAWKKNRYVLITFDDGYKDNVKAAEILNNYSMKGLFFISTAYIGKTMNGVKMLDENDIERLVLLGMAIGSHSHNHTKLPKLNTDEIDKEISQSLKILSRFFNVEDFAYPFGSYSQKVVNILQQNKVKRAYIIGQKIYQIDKFSEYEIPRAIVRKNTSLTDFYLLITRGRARI